jgi:hypothetical protein
MSFVGRWLTTIVTCGALAGCHWLLPYGAGDAGRDRPLVGDWPGVAERFGADGPPIADGGPLDGRRDRRGDQPASASCKDIEMLGLPVIAAPTLIAAMATFNSGCKTGSTFCQLQQARAYQVPACFAGAPTLLGVLPHVLEQGDQEAQDWQQLSSAGVQSTFFFSTTYSTNGPALLQAVNSFGGATTPAGLFVEGEVPCQNCTKRQSAMVLLYPTRMVVRLDGTYGYDS